MIRGFGYREIIVFVSFFFAQKNIFLILPPRWELSRFDSGNKPGSDFVQEHSWEVL